MIVSFRPPRMLAERAPDWSDGKKPSLEQVTVNSKQPLIPCSETGPRVNF
jgi:hypothetical protein